MIDSPNQNSTLNTVGASTSSNRSRGTHTPKPHVENEALVKKVLSYDPRGWSTISGFKLELGLEVLAWCALLNPEGRTQIEEEIFTQFKGLCQEREARRRKPVFTNPPEPEPWKQLLLDISPGQ